ncbi:inositol monophosphatase family protein [Mycobacterium sp. NPDC003449]
MPNEPQGRASCDEKDGVTGNLAELLSFAEELARRAGRQVLDAALDRSEAVTKSGAADWLTPVDENVEDLVRSAISDRYPTHGIVGEERGAVEGTDVVWHIDPIDGTTNFLYGLGNVSVSIAAFDTDGPAVGVVHDVYREQTIGAARGSGVRLNRVPIPVPDAIESVTGQVILTEWSEGYRAWAGMEPFLQWVSGEQATVRIIGSCALSLAHAGLGRAAATILPGRYNSWDVAAGVVIATEGGCQLFDACGPTLGLPQNGLLVAGTAVAQTVWEAWRLSAPASGTEASSVN